MSEEGEHEEDMDLATRKSEPKLVSYEEHCDRQQWAWEHYYDLPDCVECQKMSDCAFSPTSACCLFVKEFEPEEDETK